MSNILIWYIPPKARRSIVIFCATEMLNFTPPVPVFVAHPPHLATPLGNCAMTGCNGSRPVKLLTVKYYFLGVLPYFGEVKSDTSYGPNIMHASCLYATDPNMSTRKICLVL